MMWIFWLTFSIASYLVGALATARVVFLLHKDRRDKFTMAYISATWIATFWPIVVPLAAPVYLAYRFMKMPTRAERRAERELKANLKARYLEQVARENGLTWIKD